MRVLAQRLADQLGFCLLIRAPPQQSVADFGIDACWHVHHNAVSAESVSAKEVVQSEEEVTFAFHSGATFETPPSVNELKTPLKNAQFFARRRGDHKRSSASKFLVAEKRAAAKGNGRPCLRVA